MEKTEPFPLFSTLFDKLVNGLFQILNGLPISLFHGMHNTVVNVIFHNHPGGAIDGSPHGRQLDQHLAAIPSILHHLAHGLQMSNGPAQPVEHCFCIRVDVGMAPLAVQAGGLLLFFRMMMKTTLRHGPSPLSSMLYRISITKKQDTVKR